MTDKPDKPKYLRVKNLEKYQSYKDGRNIVWVKFFCSILDDPTFAILDDDSKFLYPYLIILGAKTKNLIPNNSKWIQGKLGFNKKIPIQNLISAGFLIPVLYDSVEIRENPARHSPSPSPSPSPEEDCITKSISKTDELAGMDTKLVHIPDSDGEFE